MVLLIIKIFSNYTLKMTKKKLNYRYSKKISKKNIQTGGYGENVLIKYIRNKFKDEFKTVPLSSVSKVTGVLKSKNII